MGNISCSSESKNSERKIVSKKSESKNSENKSDSGGNSSLDLNDILGTWYSCLENGGEEYYSFQTIIKESSDGNYKMTTNEYTYDDEDCTEGEKEWEDSFYEFEVTIEKSGNGFEICFPEEEFEKLKEESDGEVSKCFIVEFPEDDDELITWGGGDPMKRRK